MEYTHTMYTQWRSQPKIFGEAKYHDFKQVTVRSLWHWHHLSKHKTTRYARNVGSVYGLVGQPLATPMCILS